MKLTRRGWFVILTGLVLALAIYLFASRKIHSVTNSTEQNERAASADVIQLVDSLMDRLHRKRLCPIQGLLA